MLVGLDKSIRWKFAAGGVPIGVVVTQMQYFVMIYYSQVLGLPASLAGLAIAIALVADAVWDPAVGFVSDNWKSRWGRRHPFMYASIPLISLFYLMLWLPPSGLGGVALFWYLLVCLVGSRLTFALFEIPSSALVPELSGDYEERARLFSYRELVYWVTGSLLGGVLMYAIWLRATPEYPDGFLNPDGYRAAARDCVLLAVVGLLMASVGLHRFIPQLSAPVAKLRFGLAEFLRQVGDVLRLPSLRTMIIAGVLSATAGGVNMVLWVYAMGYFFGMSSSQMSPLMLVSALGGLTSLWLGPRLLAGREKRRVAIGLTLAGATLSGLPIVLRLLGAFPENETTALFVALVVITFVQAPIAVLLMGIVTSMIADLVEQAQLETARRSEGIILATVTLTRKVAMALGTVLAGVVLDLARFPRGSAVDEVPASSLFSFGLLYGPLQLALGVLSAYMISLYTVNRIDHERAVTTLLKTGSM